MLLVNKIRDYLESNKRKNGSGRKVRISDAGQCERKLFFDAAGVERTHPLSHEQLLVFERGIMAEEILRPIIENIDGVTVVHDEGNCARCLPDKRQGIHCEVETPEGRKKKGHADAIILKPIEAVMDYKSVTESSFDWRVRHGADEKNVAQVNLYIHAMRDSYVDVARTNLTNLNQGVILYYDPASGRLHEEVFDYDREMAIRTLQAFDWIEGHVDEYREFLKENSKVDPRMFLTFAPPKPYNDPDSFPCAYTKHDKTFRCPFWGYCYGEEETELEDKDVELPGELELVAEQYMQAANKARLAKKEKKKLRTMLLESLREFGAMRGRAGDYKVNVNRRSKTWVDRSALSPEALANAERRTEYEVLRVIPNTKGE